MLGPSGHLPSEACSPRPTSSPRTGDHIVMVNGVSMESVNSTFAIQILKTCAKMANIVSGRGPRPRSAHGWCERKQVGSRSHFTAWTLRPRGAGVPQGHPVDGTEP